MNMFFISFTVVLNLKKSQFGRKWCFLKKQSPCGKMQTRKNVFARKERPLREDADTATNCCVLVPAFFVGFCSYCLVSWRAIMTWWHAIMAWFHTTMAWLHATMDGMLPYHNGMFPDQHGVFPEQNPCRDMPKISENGRTYYKQPLVSPHPLRSNMG